ncbi:hypothetical protein L596_028602 [Steinernema carpocapsae]|uniref:MIF4G domain-containing protein n=1 Tax=Steinernema carpocapsae TaxID=34508 RepID=A0A4U5LYY0_STECR|nr:hypothetical protein L596_028602 [Steinernema carpocapsae]
MAERKAKGKTGGGSSFRANILRRAQKTFERTEDSKLDNLQKQLAEEEEEAKKKNLQDKITELKAKEKRRIHGNIAFIGELFRHGIVSQSIVNWCVVSLIKETKTVKPDDASIECAVKMLASVGKVWDAQTVVEEKKSAWGAPAAGSNEAQPKHNTLSIILGHLKQISDTKQYAPRTRFMIVDLLDLKKNNWIPRNSAEKGPKTKQEIADEVKREQRLKEMQRYNWERQDRMASTRDAPTVRTIRRRRI